MDYIDNKAIEVLINKTTEFYESLSDNAKAFITNNMDEDDVEDFYHIISYYQRVIQARFYMEPEDEDDYAKIELMKKMINSYMNLMDRDLF